VHGGARLGEAIRRPATFEDLLKVPDHLVAEIPDGSCTSRRFILVGGFAGMWKVIPLATMDTPSSQSDSSARRVQGSR